MEQLERCSVVVVTRDRFSTTARCLQEVINHTPEGAYDLIAVIGGAPEKVRRDLESRFGDKVRFIFEDRFLNPAQARNIGLRACASRLAVLMDNDVYPRSGWLEPLLRCQKETGAAMVVPVILEPGDKIHTAGNDLFISHKNGKAFGQKTLRFYQVRYFDSNNLKRQPTDYGELHCQLVVAETAIRLGVYDEHIHEVGEVDSGLTWKKAGCPLWFEPASVVLYDKPERVRRAEDILFFKWRWNMRIILEGYRYFQNKWDMDISDGGNFKDFLVSFNCKLGLAPRMFPNSFGLLLDGAFRKLSGAAGNIQAGWRMRKARAWGYGEWVREYKNWEKGK